MAPVDTLKIVRHPNEVWEGFNYRISYSGNRNGCAQVCFETAGGYWQSATRSVLSLELHKMDRVARLEIFFPHGDFDYGPEELAMRKGIGSAVLRTIAGDSYNAGAKIMAVLTNQEKMKSFLGKHGFKAAPEWACYVRLLSELLEV